ncbi:amidohydrolase family protein [Neorhizobium sp. NCHU2750]|uniref:amidohydrolase family protein n=1 Tax=Neorhizobium sp. NCHU2750 TaxID=1825976 RepID=UPI000E76B461|nr:cytosine deaminase [Neorhizobium sp. NCHU2750]
MQHNDDGNFIIDNIRLAAGHGPKSIHVSNGRIAAIGTVTATDTVKRLDGAGALLMSGFTDAHVHLDKAMILGRCPLCEGTLAEAVRLTADAKRGFTAEDVETRGRKVLEMAVRAGTQRMRSFVEVDPRAGLRSLEGLLRLRQEWAALIDLQLCAFAQEGLTNEPETLTLLDEALRMGADLVGGCPYTDPDPAAHVGLIFDMAGKHDVDVDFHADFNLDPENSILPEIIRQTVERGWQGRVTVGHATKFAAFDPERRTTIAKAMADAGVALVVLPATDAFLNGSRDNPLRPRGIAPAKEIRDLGVTVALATNNIQNPFTPFGDASLLRMAGLYANLDQLATDADMRTIHTMITSDAEKITGMTAPALSVGEIANFILLAAETAEEAVRSNAAVVGVVKSGVVRLWAPVQPLRMTN